MTFDDLRKLGRNWDSYRAEPIDADCIREAQLLSYILPGQWDAIPCPDGSVQLERHADGFDMELLVSKSQAAAPVPEGFPAISDSKLAELAAGKPSPSQRTCDAVWLTCELPAGHAGHHRCGSAVWARDVRAAPMIGILALIQRLKDHAAIHSTFAAASDEQRQWGDDLESVIATLSAALRPLTPLPSVAGVDIRHLAALAYRDGYGDMPPSMDEYSGETLVEICRLTDTVEQMRQLLHESEWSRAVLAESLIEHTEGS